MAVAHLYHLSFLRGFTLLEKMPVAGLETMGFLYTHQILKAKLMKIHCECKKCIAGELHGCGSKFWIMVSVAENEKGKCQKLKVVGNEEF